jgi:bifunctional DNA-binding transcriptional regulator/antitoxin component of YhaV-PrlF toxin-antitoxin module
MRLCYKTSIDQVGRVYIPKEVLAATNAKQGTPLYILADEDTGSIVIATEQFFKKKKKES